MKNRLRTSFPAVSRNEALARGLAAQFLMLLDPTVEQLSDIRTAVSEAVTNAIVHGYAGRNGEVEMELTSENGLVARTPFYTTAPEAERSGLGFAVMEAFMDEVTVDSEPEKGTSVTMKKRIRPNE